MLAAINRAVEPLPKSGIGHWFETTILSRLIPATKNQLDSRRFWDNMEQWTKEDMEKFEAEFVPFLIEKYRLEAKCLVYDATNFFTYIDTANKKSQLVKRGHSKEKRNNLRIIGLSLLISGKDEIPLFYETYEGNRPDTKQFAEVVQKLKSRYQSLFGKEPDITLVFDRGNNFKTNISSLYDDVGVIGFHYVGGLKASQGRYIP